MDITKTKTLFLDLVPAYDNSNLHIYCLVESESTLLQHAYSKRPPSRWAVNIAKGLQFVELKADSAVVHTTATDTSGTTILSIDIENIYGEDDENADDPIFIDVRPDTPKDITNQGYLAILPIRHPLHQVCQPCLDNYVTTDYAGSAITACVEFDGARRMKDATNVQTLPLRRAGITSPSVPTLSVPLLDTIAGFQLRNIAYAADKTNVEMFLDTNAFLVGIHHKEIARDALIFFGMDANPTITFSIDMSDLMDLPSPPSQVAGSTRALLQTLPSAPTETMQIVRVLLQIHRTDQDSNEEASLNYVLYIYIAIAGGIVLLLLMIVLTVVLIYYCKDKGNDMTLISQAESNDHDMDL